tara:strand:+ start:506 stop:607 length:102 start_codon:yes stop_codon:yes gene_type:complete
MEGREYREHWEEAHLKEYLKLINYKDELGGFEN